MSAGKIIGSVVCLVMCLFLVFSTASLFENVDANEIVCIQAPMSGKLTWYTTAGTKWQGFGKVTSYKKRDQFKFEKVGGKDDSMKIRFNDGGNATISGSISWEMPLDNEHLTSLHTKYNSQEAIERQLVNTVVDKSVFMTGPHMSSTESYASRRSDLLRLIEDQIENGIILTRSTQSTEKDAITGQDRTVTKVIVEMDGENVPKRVKDTDPLKTEHIKTFNLTINHIEYESVVEDQIKQQQKSVSQVQFAIAEAKRAEQEVLTTEKEGEALAAKAEWAQKTIAAKQIEEAKMNKSVAETKAEMQLEIAKLQKETAEQTKMASIAEGEGESKRRQLIMEADGALEKKLEALVSINKAYAEAIAAHNGPLVPSIIMGGGGDTSGGMGVTQLIELLTAKAARDLSLDLSMPVVVKK